MVSDGKKNKVLGPEVKAVLATDGEEKLGQTGWVCTLKLQERSDYG